MLSLKKPEEFIGSACVYYTFRFFTILQIIIGLGNLVTGILVSIDSRVIDWYNLSYLCIGLLVFLLAMFSHITYDAPNKLICYLVFLFIAFGAELGFTVAVLLLGTLDEYFGSLYAQTAEYALFGASGCLFLGFSFGSWYLATVRDAYLERENFKLLSKH